MHFMTIWLLLLNMCWVPPAERRRSLNVPGPDQPPTIPGRAIVDDVRKA
jgi:hypothetical protein